MKRVIKAAGELASGWLTKARKSGYSLRELEDIYNTESGKVIHIYDNPTREEVEDFKSWCNENVFGSKKVTAAKSYKSRFIISRDWESFIDRLEKATGWKVADEDTYAPNEIDDFYITAYDYSTGDEVELDIKVTPAVNKDGEVKEYLTFLDTDVKIVK